MKRLRFYSLVFALLFLVSGFGFAFQPSPLLQLAFGGFLFALLVLGLISGVVAIAQCSRQKLRAFVPATICLVSILFCSFVAIPLGGMARLWKFRRDLTNYMDVVKRVEKGEIKTGILLSRIDLPKEYSHLAYSCEAKTNFFGGITVEFVVGGGFPVKHSGFLYVSNGSIESDLEIVRRWPKHTRINEKWFTISD